MKSVVVCSGQDLFLLCYTKRRQSPLLAYFFIVGGGSCGGPQDFKTQELWAWAVGSWGQHVSCSSYLSHCSDKTQLKGGRVSLVHSLRAQSMMGRHGGRNMRIVTLCTQSGSRGMNMATPLALSFHSLWDSSPQNSIPHIHSKSSHLR